MSRVRLEFSVLTHNAAKWPLPGRILLGCALAGVVMLVGDLVYLSPSRERLRKVEVQEVSLQQQLAEKAVLAADLEERARQVQLMREKVSGLLQQMPEESEMPGFLEDIARMALANGLVIESITPLDKLSRSLYHEQPVRIGATGTYHDLATFVSALGGLLRIATAHDIAITRDGKLLRLDLLAKTYWYERQGIKRDAAVTQGQPFVYGASGIRDRSSPLPCKSTARQDGRPLRRTSLARGKSWKATQWISSRWSARCPWGTDLRLAAPGLNRASPGSRRLSGGPGPMVELQLFMTAISNWSSYFPMNRGGWLERPRTLVLNVNS